MYMCNVWIFTLCIHMQGFLASITRDTTQSIELAIPNRPTSVMDPWCETKFHGQILNFQDSTTFRRYNLTIYPTTYFSTHTPSPPKKKTQPEFFTWKKHLKLSSSQLPFVWHSWSALWPSQFRKLVTHAVAMHACIAQQPQLLEIEAKVLSNLRAS